MKSKKKNATPEQTHSPEVITQLGNPANWKLTFQQMEDGDTITQQNLLLAGVPDFYVRAAQEVLDGHKIKYTIMKDENDKPILRAQGRENLKTLYKQFPEIDPKKLRGSVAEVMAKPTQWELSGVEEGAPQMVLKLRGATTDQANIAKSILTRSGVPYTHDKEAQTLTIANGAVEKLQQKFPALYEELLRDKQHAKNQQQR